jgi:hypothetical protein
VPRYQPDFIRRTVRYSEYAAYPGIAGVINTNTFWANGLFDPNLTGTGHQPYAFDQYMALYLYATVLSSRCTVECVATTVPVCFGVGKFLTSSPGFSSYNTYIESGQCVFRLQDSESADHNRVSLTADIGVSLTVADVVEDNTLANTNAANPSQGLFYVVFAQDVNQTSTVNSEVNVVIDYDVVFHGLRSVTPS